MTGTNFWEHEKQRLRKEFLARRQALSEAERADAIGRIVDAVCRHIADAPSAPFAPDAPVVTLYRSFRGEVDVWPCAGRLWQLGFTVAVPMTDRQTKTMTFARVDETTSWNTGAFGIPEPDMSTLKVVEAHSIRYMVVPGVAFTKSGVRLGYGGGYYDRFFSAFTPSTKPVLVGVAFSCQLADDLPSMAHDVRMDILITEDGVRTCTPQPSS